MGVRGRQGNPSCPDGRKAIPHMSDDRRMHLGLTIWPTGFHPVAWRLPGSHPDGNSNPTLLRDAARTAERGIFDFFFIGDRPAWV